MGANPTYMGLTVVETCMVEEWTDSMTARERVETIATTLSEPRTANWVAEQADVKWDTAKRHLDDLVASGVLVETDGGEYVPDPTRAYFEELRELILANDREQLRAELEGIAERIDEWKATYDVDSLEELEATLAEDLSAEEVRERRRVLRRWETSQEDRQLVQAALALYEDVQSLAESVPGGSRVEGWG
jgi:predicted ArsR family transcriptional regulator